ncbi:MAG: arylsulfatase A-like enzyme [Myxococcota bacterium]
MIDRKEVTGELAAAAVGAALFGLADAATISAGGALVSSASRTVLLMLADGGALAVLGAVSVLPLRLLPFEALRGRWPAFLWGGLIATLAALTEWWFTSPPSFVASTATDAVRGSTPMFGLTLIGLLGLYVGVCSLAKAPRARVGILLGLTAALTARSMGSVRNLPAIGEVPRDAPSVMLVTFDTTRADYFAAYGNPTIATPRFDAIAAEGALFEETWSQIPVTGPSHTTVFTGQAPWEHGALLNGVSVNPDVVMLAEHLRAKGWRTGGFVSAYVLDGDLGFSRGFEVYDDDFGWLQGWSDTLPGRLSAAVTRRFNPEHVLERRGGRTVDQALSWLGNVGEDESFFVWIHLFDPHGPYAPPPPWDTAYYQGDPRDPAHTSMEHVEGVAGYLLPTLDGITDADWVLGQYAGEISYADEQLGRLMDWLDTTGRSENTLLMMAGDHGESLGEHGVWFNHGDDLFESALKVPLAVRMPGRIEPGTVVSVPVELTDLAPTIYDLLKVKPPPTVRGVPLTDAFADPTFSPRTEARAMSFDRQANLEARRAGEITAPIYRMMALRKPGNYLFVRRDAPGYDDALYDLSSGTEFDPPVDNPGLSRALAESASDHLKTMTQEALDRSGAEPDEATQDALRALGYIE